MQKLHRLLQDFQLSVSHNYKHRETKNKKRTKNPSFTEAKHRIQTPPSRKQKAVRLYLSHPVKQSFLCFLLVHNSAVTVAEQPRWVVSGFLHKSTSFHSPENVSPIRKFVD